MKVASFKKNMKLNLAGMSSGNLTDRSDLDTIRSIPEDIASTKLPTLVNT